MELAEKGIRVASDTAVDRLVAEDASGEREHIELTAQEHDLLRRLVAGQIEKEAAHDLHLGVKTAERLIANIKHRLDAPPCTPSVLVPSHSVSWRSPHVPATRMREIGHEIEGFPRQIEGKPYRHGLLLLHTLIRMQMDSINTLRSERSTSEIPTLAQMTKYLQNISQTMLQAQVSSYDRFGGLHQVILTT